MSDEKERISKQAAVEWWRAKLPRLLGSCDPEERLVDLLRWLNSVTECDVDDPLGFFLTDAYDERMKEREQVKRVLSGNVGKLVGDSSALNATDKLGSPLPVDAVLRIINELIRMSDAKSLGERKSNSSGLYAGNDELNSLITFKGPVVFIGRIGR